MQALFKNCQLKAAVKSSLTALQLPVMCLWIARAVKSAENYGHGLTAAA